MAEGDFWRSTLREIYARIEVWRGLQRHEDFRAGLICATLANIHRDSKRHPQPFTPEDFMPGEKKRQPGVTEAQWRMWAKQMRAAYGG